MIAIFGGLFQSTLPARGSDDSHPETPARDGVSIHAPREGERLFQHADVEFIAEVSIHAPREGERLGRPRLLVAATRFQSTLPARGSDKVSAVVKESDIPGFNPRSPRGGATPPRQKAACAARVSIHAPREGERPAAKCRNGGEVRFQSTLPARGSDARLKGSPARRSGFQSTLPARGSDNVRMAVSISRLQFQSTLPARGSDWQDCLPADLGNVSIHAPREGERRALLSPLFPKGEVSIHAPREGERLPFANDGWATCPSFNPRSPRGGATVGRRKRVHTRLVSIHAPREGERPAPDAPAERR